ARIRYTAIMAQRQMVLAERNRDINNLKKWLRNYFVVLKYATADRPQLLVTLGIKVLTEDYKKRKREKKLKESNELQEFNELHEFSELKELKEPGTKHQSSNTPHLESSPHTATNFNPPAPNTHPVSSIKHLVSSSHPASSPREEPVLLPLELINRIGKKQPNSILKYFLRETCEEGVGVK
ncbi:MAG: hypothetical protein GY757_58095, partial [bacterium]|nr:hypothetical protein [bacterium]